MHEARAHREGRGLRKMREAVGHQVAQVEPCRGAGTRARPALLQGAHVGGNACAQHRARHRLKGQCAAQRRLAARDQLAAALALRAGIVRPGVAPLAPVDPIGLRAQRGRGRVRAQREDDLRAQRERRRLDRGERAVPGHGGDQTVNAAYCAVLRCEQFPVERAGNRLGVVDLPLRDAAEPAVANEENCRFRMRHVVLLTGGKWVPRSARAKPVQKRFKKKRRFPSLAGKKTRVRRCVRTGAQRRFG